MHLHAEVRVMQLSKIGEELCGDNVDVIRTPNGTIIVLSDGLGSGVKARMGLARRSRPISYGERETARCGKSLSTAY